tara:strand:- start:212 stop:826 length:615 start_codon:yes stop_codon:yes gene_type:complete
MKFPFTKKCETLVSDALKNNKIIVFPTETLYGLGGNAFSKSVVEKIYKIKKRSSEKSLILLINLEWLNSITTFNDSRVADLIEKFWPGPLTLILKANKLLPDHLKNDTGTVAVRYTSSSVAQRLIELGNCPVIGTSANLSGFSPCSSLKEVKTQLKNRVDFYVDGGVISKNRPSTIVNCLNTDFKVLRHGAISLKALNRVCKVI